MARPDGITEAAWAEANDALITFLRDERCGTAVRFGMSGRAQNAATESIARAIMAAEARGRAAEREECIAACEAQKIGFQSEEYAYPQPVGSLIECMVVDTCADAIRKRSEAV